MTAPRPLDTPVASVTLSSEQVTLGEGASLALQAVARDDDAGVVSDRPIFWSSSDTAVVRVSGAGLLTAVRAGTAQIAASVDGRSATARVTVTARAVASIQITPTAPSVLKGGFAQLTARTLDDAGGLLQNRVVFWGSSDAAIAVVDVGGVVTGIAPGVATVTATSESRTAAVGITVLRVPVASVLLTPARDTIVLGQSTQLVAVPRDSAGASLDDLVTYTSSAAAIATVSSSGLVVGVAAGTTTITASAGGRSATSIILVQPRPVGAVIVSPAQSSLTIGQTVQLSVQITDANGNLLTGRPVAYQSSNTNVASVTAGGLVRAVATGTATITISSEGKTGTATVTVSPSPIATLRVAPATSSLVIGTTVQLAATALDAAGNALAQRSITWTSGAPTVVSVDAAGLVTAVGVGSALVFASAEGRLATATITVSGIAPSSMTVEPVQATVIAGQSRDLVATLRDGTGTVITGRTVQWTSTNNTVAVVSSTGRVRGVAPGTVRIDANTDGVIGSATIVVVPVPIATITVALGSPSLLVGATTQATAVARDSVGGLLTGRAVVWSSSNPAVATVSATGLVTAVALGTASIRATSDGVTGATSVSVVVGLPTTVAANSATTQSAAAATAVAAPPSVRVSDAGGTGVAGVTVTFAVASGGGAIVPSTVVTNASGIATLTSWTLGTASGTNTVTATATGLTGSPVLFSANGTAGAATQLALTTAPSGAVSGEVFAVQPVVAIHDANGNVVASSAPVTVSIVTGSGVLAGTTTINAANGIATFTNLRLTGIDSYTLRFASAGLASVTSAPFSVTAGVPTQLAITTQPAGSSSGLAFITQPVVVLRDAGGNQTTSTAAVTATIASGTGVLSGTATVNAVNGVATFTNLALTGTGSHTLRFSSTSLTPVVSNAIVIGAPTTIAANSAVTQSATVATDVATPPSVRVTDAAGIGASGVTVTFAVISGGGTISPSTVVTDASGVATLTQWTLGVTAGANSVRATVAGLAGNPVNFAATGTAGAPTQLAITRQPAGAVSGEAFTTQPVVVLRDVHGNLTTSTAAVTVAVLAGTGTLSGTLVVNAVNGTATFTDLALAGLGNHTLRFTSPGVSNVTSASFALVAGAPSQVVITTQPAGASSGLVFATQPVVALRDATGNPTTSTATVTASIVTGTGTLGGTIAVAAVNGVATFTNLSITGSGAHTIRFAAPSMTSATSNSLVVGAAANIAPNSVTAQTAIAGANVATPPSVRVTDLGGQGVSGISVAYAVISGGGSISQATVVTDAGGFATLTSWTLGTTAGANSVRATVAGLTGNPVTFNATGVAGPATQLTITTQPNGAVAGVALVTQPVIAIRDVNGNVTSSTAAVSASVASGNGAVSGTTTVNAVNGVATFTDITLSGGGNHTLRFTSAGLGNVVSATFVVGGATTIAANSVTTQSATAGANVSARPSVLVTDAAADPVSGVVVTFAVTGGGGTITPTSVTTNASGIATVTNWTLGTVAGANTATATVAGLTGSPVTFSATGIVGAATQLAITTQPSGATSGAVFTTQPVVAIRDVNGNQTASTAAVTAAIFSGTGTLTGTTTVNAVNGVATFTNLVITGSGAHTIRFTSGALTNATSASFTVTTGGATTIAANSVVTQSAVAGTAVATDPSVLVTNASAAPVAGVTVTFAVTAGGGAVSPSTVVTNASGIATLTSWTLGTTAGPNTVTASAAGLTGSPVTFNATGTAGAATQLAITTQPSGATTGAAFTTQPVVAIRDANGNQTTSTAAVTAAIFSGTGTLSGTATVNAVNGVATFTNLVITGSGAHTIRFTSGALTNATSASFTVIGPPTQLAITTQPGGATSGAAFTTQPVIAIRDANGNLTSSTAAVTAAIFSGTGTLSGTATVNAVNGVATFTNLVITGSGAHTIRFTSGALTNATSASFTVAASGATTIAANSVVTQSAVAGTAVAADPSVLVTDAAAAPVAGVTVTFAVTAGGGAVSPSTVVTNASGIATLTSWTLGTTAGPNTVTASAAGLTGSPVTFNATGTAGAATQLAITTQPSGATTGAAFTTQPVAAIRDANGNQTTSTAAVTAAIFSGTGTLSGTATVNAVNGVATFTNLVITGSGAHTIRFTSGALTNATSASFTVIGPPTQLAITTQPGGATSGAAFTTQPVIAIRDANGNLTSSTAAVTAAIFSGTGTLSGTATVNAVNGVATFTNLVITGSGAHTIRFTSGALTNATSASFTVAASGATTIAANSVVTQSAVAGTAVATDPSVLVTDAAAAPVAGVTVTFAVTAGGGAVSPSTVVTNASGVATLTSWTLGTTAGANTVTASAAGLTGSPVTFNATGTAGAATQLAITTQPTGATSGVAFTTQPVVAIRDANGNQTTSTAAVTAAIFSGTGALTGTVTVNAVNGVATFTNLVITGSGAHTIRFTSGALTNATSASFTVAASGATTIAANSVVTQSAVAGTAVATDPSVLVTDAAAAPVAGVTVTFAVTAGGGAVSPSTVVTNASGIATLTSWTLGTAAGANTVTASAAGLTGSPVTFNATGTAGAATQLAITTQPSGATTTVAFTTQPVVAIRDANGNQTTSTAAVTAAIFSGTGALTGTVTVNAVNGVATFTNLVISGTGAHTIRFTSGALSNATSTSFTVTSDATTIAANSAITQSAVAGGNATTAPSVVVTNAAAAPVAGVTVTFVVTAGGGAVSPSTVVTNASGIATLTSWTLGTAAGANTVTASAAGLTGSPVTFNATGTAGAATQLVLTTQPSGAVTGNVFTTQPIVNIRDVNGNQTTSTAAVTAAIFSGSGTLTGTVTVNAVNGVATFTNLLITGVGNHTIRFTSGALANATSSVFNVAAGPPTQLAITAQPGGAGNTAPFANQPVIAIRDADGFQTTSTAAVTAEVLTGTGTLTGIVTVNAVNGVATFGNLTLTGTGAHTLRFTSPSLTSATSASFTITAGPATTIAAQSPLSQTANVSTAVGAPPSVIVTDVSGNPVSGVSVTFAVTGGGGTIAPTTTIVTNAVGVAALTSWTLGSAAGENTVTATAAGLTGSPITFTATGTAELNLQYAAQRAPTRDPQRRMPWNVWASRERVGGVR